MLDGILEWCADIFGVTMRSRLGHLIVASLAVFVLGVVLMQRWSFGGWVLPLLLVVIAAFAAREVASARDAVWRAACLRLDDAHQRPALHAIMQPSLIPPTAVALHRLAGAVDAARRAQYVSANEWLPHIERRLLRPEEAQLLDAVRAMVSLGLGDSRRAAQQAVTALPTGSEDLDGCLGRTVVADAWNDPVRLRAIAVAWERAGVGRDHPGSLPRLQKLVRLRIDPDLLDGLGGADARAIADEARAIGADDLATELDARSRPTAYR